MRGWLNQKRLSWGSTTGIPLTTSPLSWIFSPICVIMTWSFVPTSRMSCNKNRATWTCNSHFQYYNRTESFGMAKRTKSWNAKSFLHEDIFAHRNLNIEMETAREHLQLEGRKAATGRSTILFRFDNSFSNKQQQIYR